MNSRDNHIKIFVVSDFTGETIEIVTKAAIRQFENVNATIKKYRYINNKQRSRRVIDEAVDEKAVITCTLVDHELRKWFVSQAKVMGVDVIDVLGPMLDVFSAKLDMEPLEKPGLAHRMDEAYFKRVKAVEFSIACDDGSNTQMLNEAELILIGVSRTCKTPLSMYLAHKGLMTANIPLVPGLDPPEELFSVDPKNVIGLTIKPEKLQQVRKERLQMMGLDPDGTSYSNIENVTDEIKHSREVMKKLGCKVFDVTEKAIEETAQEILTYIGYQNW